jgi:hypothetical protein
MGVLFTGHRRPQALHQRRSGLDEGAIEQTRTRRDGATAGPIGRIPSVE